jgi:uncharacterized protein (TIRG00374 family)
VDRVFDAVVVLSMMFVAMLLPSFPAGAAASVARLALGGVIFVVGVVLMLYLIVFFPARIITLYELLARRVAPRFEARGRAVLEAFANGLSVLRSPRRFFAVFWWAVLHWLVNALAFWIAFEAVGIDAPFGMALFTQGIIAIGVAVPSSPGFFGAFEAFGRIALAVYGLSQTVAVTWAVGFHLLSFFPITFIGAYYFARAGLTFAELGSGGAKRAADVPNEHAGRDHSDERDSKRPPAA